MKLQDAFEQFELYRKMPFSDLSIDDFEFEWDKRTTSLVVPVGGGQNMFGGGGFGIHVTIHGENSKYETGRIDLDGSYRYSVNIARGENGGNRNHITYWEHGEFDTSIPKIKIGVEGKVNGARAALCCCLRAKLAFLKPIN